MGKRSEEMVYCVFGLDPNREDHERVMLDGGYAFQEDAWAVALEIFPEYKAYSVGMSAQQYMYVMYGENAPIVED